MCDMATIKSTFHVRKSSRFYSKSSQSEQPEKCESVNKLKAIHPNSDNVEGCHFGSPPRTTWKQVLENRALSTRSDLSQSSTPTSKSSISSQTLTSPSYATPRALAKCQSSWLTSGASPCDLAKACRQLLSPTKRKSDDENKFTPDAPSPVKSSRPSPSDSTPVKCILPPHNSPMLNKSHYSPGSPETPKSSRRPSKKAPIVPTSTPRRLFGTPGKEDQKEGDGTPVKYELNTFHSPSRTCGGLSSPSFPRSTAKPYQAAKRSLHTAKPDRLIGRDNEMAELEDFVCEKLDSGTGGSMYISGAPGTGKTAVMNYMIDKLKSEYSGIKTAYINCMMLKDSNAVLRQVYEHLTGSPIKTKDAMRAMETLFTTCDKCILLVLDEIDQLDTKHHHILYSIFEWPTMKNSKLVLIGIANALDLTDRVLPRLQASKTCRPSLMNFQPYTSVQITDILKHRLERDSVVEPSAVNFCARKVSAVAGDVRKALDICRRAVEMVESESRSDQVLRPADCNSPTKRKPPVELKKVTISHISKVMSDVYGSSVSAANSSENDVPLQQKLAVCSLLLLVRNGKLKEVQLGKLHETYTKVCRRQQMAPIDQSEFHSVLSLLDSRGVVVLKKAKDTRLTKVSLKLNEQELEQTLQDKALMAAILRDGVPK